MKQPIALAAFFIALGSFAPLASGQQVYRCGKSYSQVPCPGARVVDTRDVRSPKQKAQSQRVIQRDTELAEDLQASRKQEEAMAAAASTPTEIAAPVKFKKSSKSSKSDKAQSSKKAKAQDELFTAKIAPPDKKKK